MDSKIFLGKYRVSAEELEPVGEPGEGPAAYNGEEIHSGKKVVVEVNPGASMEMGVRQQLEARAIAAKKLNHVNIPALYDFGVEDDNLVYVTEDCDGTRAEDWVNAHGPMPVGPVLRIAAQVVSALGAAAFHKIVHRAINPSNLVLVPGQTAEGEWPLVKVLHFVGGAPKPRGTDAAAPAFDKSLPYASPEQLRNGGVDFRSEIFSLGGTMWFLLTGAPPPLTENGPVAMQLSTTGLAQEKMKAIPNEVRRLLTQMLAPNPDARPRDPLAFHRRLQDCLSQAKRPVPLSRKLAASVPPRPDPTGVPENQHSLLMALARVTALFLALGAIGALALLGYVRYHRTVRTDKPFRLPIGATKAHPSATPVRAKGADSMVWIVTQPPRAVAGSNRTYSAPAGSPEQDDAEAKARPPAADSGELASTKQVAPVPLPPTKPNVRGGPQTQKQVSATTNTAGASSAAIDSPAVARTSQAGATPKGSPNETASAASVETAPNKNIMHEVRRAESVEPEVRRAEAAHPIAPAATTSPAASPPLSQPTSSPARGELDRGAKRPTAETTPRTVKKTRPEPTILLKVPREKKDEN